MEPASRKTAGAGRLRRLNEPQAVVLVTDREGRPQSLELRGRRRQVSRIEEAWRIEGEWWRQLAVGRTYFRLVLDDGPVVVVYRDDRGGSWWIQRY